MRSLLLLFFVALGFLTVGLPLALACPEASSLKKLSTSAAGMRVSTANDETWADDVAIVNYAFQPVPMPCAVLFARHEADVIAAVKWVKATNVSFTIRAGLCTFATV